MEKNQLIKEIEQESKQYLEKIEGQLKEFAAYNIEDLKEPILQWATDFAELQALAALSPTETNLLALELHCTIGITSLEGIVRQRFEKEIDSVWSETKEFLLTLAEKVVSLGAVAARGFILGV